jgi:cytoskeletal protein CcmA (bactofilin family)
MIFRRRQDEMEGFRRMREALRQQADPQDHALLDDDQYDLYDEEDEAELVDVPDGVGDDESVTGSDIVPASGDDESAAPLVAASAPPPAALGETFPRARQPERASTTIGADTSWSGTLRSESDVYLEGRVEGTLEVRDTVYIAEQAAVDARIKARSVVVSGQLTGRIECDGRLEVTPTGRVNGEIEVGSLIVHEGAVLDGTFKMKQGTVGPAR